MAIIALNKEEIQYLIDIIDMWTSGFPDARKQNVDDATDLQEIEDLEQLLDHAAGLDELEASAIDIRMKLVEELHGR